MKEWIEHRDFYSFPAIICHVSQFGDCKRLLFPANLSAGFDEFSCSVFFLLGAEMSNICCCAVDIIVAKAMPSCVLIRLCMPCATPYLFSDPTWGGYICASI